jgi:hypothetical protein
MIVSLARQPQAGDFPLCDTDCTVIHSADEKNELFGMIQHEASYQL